MARSSGVIAELKTAASDALPVAIKIVAFSVGVHSAPAGGLSSNHENRFASAWTVCATADKDAIRASAVSGARRFDTAPSKLVFAHPRKAIW